MAEYRLSPAAEADLERIWKYTRREWGTRTGGTLHGLVDHSLPAVGRIAKVRASV
jgi:hypothetical protein